MLLARLFLLAAFAVSASFAQGAWRFANPLPHGNNIIDLALTNGLYWEIGDRGSVHTSPDLDAWTPHETGTRNSLRGIAFFSGKIYISGESGLILSGPNADSLTARFLNTTDWLESIAASPSAVVAVGDNGAIYYSPDGQTWTRKGNFTTWIRSVAYGMDQFMCVGETGFVATSPDGQTWTQRSVSTTANLNRVVFINDRFWIVGDRGTVITNNFRNSLSFVNIGAITNDLSAVAGNTSDIVLAGELIVLAGTVAGGNWVSQVAAPTAAPAPSWPYYSALWDGRLFLLGGRTGMKVEGFRTNSTSPLQWFSDPQVTRNWLWSVTRTPEIYAASGATGTIVTSQDGFTWNREVVPAAAANEILLGIGGNSRALVAAGSAGTLLTSPNILTNTVITNASGQLQTNTVSLLGLFWNAVSSTTPNDLQGVAANASTYVVTGAKGTILTSPNATNWTKRVSGTATYLSGVTAWPGGFVTCGDAGVILSSLDGTLWTPRNSRVTSWIYSVRYLGGKLVAVGQGGLILTSDDGLQWTQRASGTSDWINDVTYATNLWVAVAGTGTVITSPDAINWTAAKSITSRSLYSAASDGSQIVAVGLEGVILRNQIVAPQTPVDFLSYTAAGTNSFFLFGGKTGQRFSLESASSVASRWTAETTLEISDTSGTLVFQRAIAAEPTRFFRTRLLP